jgi:hypothetical protein
MKKLSFFLPLAVLLLMTACTDAKPRTLEQFIRDAKIGQADKLVIRDGNSGQARTVTKRDKIDEFLALVKDVTFTPQRDQADRTGWRYQITLSDGDREFRFTTESIDGTYYDTNPDIRTIVDDFYRGLDTTDDE